MQLAVQQKKQFLQKNLKILHQKQQMTIKTWRK